MVFHSKYGIILSYFYRGVFNETGAYGRNEFKAIVVINPDSSGAQRVNET